eukprot:jgi/Botrbrau1/6025/Bobra.0042s0011.1
MKFRAGRFWFMRLLATEVILWAAACLGLSRLVSADLAHSRTAQLREDGWPAQDLQHGAPLDHDTGGGGVWGTPRLGTAEGRGRQNQNPFVDGLPVINYTMVVKEMCGLFGWTFLDSGGPPEMVPDPIMTYYGASPISLYWWRVLDGPCGAFDWVSYTVVGKFNGFEGPEPRLRTTQSWSSNPKCCGSGTLWPYSCEVAIFKYTTLPGGKQDLSLYAPSDPEKAFLTIKGLWYSAPWISLPPSKEWAPGWFRWLVEDITTTTNGTVDGKPVKIGNGLDVGNSGDSKLVFLHDRLLGGTGPRQGPWGAPAHWDRNQHSRRAVLPERAVFLVPGLQLERNFQCWVGLPSVWHRAFWHGAFWHRGIWHKGLA